MKNLTDFRKTVETGVDPRLNTGELRYCTATIEPKNIGRI